MLNRLSCNLSMWFLPTGRGIYTVCAGQESCEQPRINRGVSCSQVRDKIPDVSKYFIMMIYMRKICKRVMFILKQFLWRCSVAALVII